MLTKTYLAYPMLEHCRTPTGAGSYCKDMRKTPQILGEEMHLALLRFSARICLRGLEAQRGGCCEGWAGPGYDLLVYILCLVSQVLSKAVFSKCLA